MHTISMFLGWMKEMTLNYLVIVEWYPFMNEVLGSLIPAMKSSLYLTKKN